MQPQDPAAPGQPPQQQPQQWPTYKPEQIVEARRLGYSDDEIARYIVEQRGANYDQLREWEYSAEQILAHVVPGLDRSWTDRVREKLVEKGSQLIAAQQDGPPGQLQALGELASRGAQRLAGALVRPPAGPAMPGDPNRRRGIADVAAGQMGPLSAGEFSTPERLFGVEDWEAGRFHPGVVTSVKRTVFGDGRPEPTQTWQQTLERIPPQVRGLYQQTAAGARLMYADWAESFWQGLAETGDERTQALAQQAIKTMQPQLRDVRGKAAEAVQATAEAWMRQPGQEPSFLQESFEQAASSLAVTAPAVALGWVFGPIYMAGGIGGTQLPMEYAEARMVDGYGKQKSLLVAGSKASLETATEFLPAKALFRTGSPVLNRLMQFMAAEIPGELVAVTGEMLIDKAAELDGDVSAEQWVMALAEAVERYPITVTSTLMAGGAQVAIAQTLDYAARIADQRKGYGINEWLDEYAKRQPPTPQELLSGPQGDAGATGPTGQAPGPDRGTPPATRGQLPAPAADGADAGFTPPPAVAPGTGQVQPPAPDEAPPEQPAPPAAPPRPAPAPPGTPQAPGAATAAGGAVQPGARPVRPEAAGPQTVTTARGTQVQVQFEVVELGDLLTSDMAGYLAEIQPRERGSRKASAVQIAEMAGQLQPERLGPSPEADRGAPIIGSADNMVESGNARVMALRRVFSGDMPEQAASYRDFVERFTGLSTEGMTAPVLVRRRATEFPTTAERRQFAIEANESATSDLAEGEQAKIDTAIITPELVDQLAASGMSLDNPANPFVRGFIAALPSSQRNSMVDSDGRVSARGMRRMRSALLARAYGGTDVSNAAITRMLESTSEDARTLTAMLIEVAPDHLRLRTAIEAGEVQPQMDIGPQLVEAVEVVRRAPNKGAIEAWLRQGDLATPRNPIVDELVVSFYQTRPDGQLGRLRALGVLTDLQRNYVGFAMGYKAEQPGGGLFGDEGAPPEGMPDQLVRQTTRQTRDREISNERQAGSQGGLFTPSGRPREVTGQDGTPPQGQPADAAGRSRADQGGQDAPADTPPPVEPPPDGVMSEAEVVAALKADPDATVFMSPPDLPLVISANSVGGVPIFYVELGQADPVEFMDYSEALAYFDQQLARLYENRNAPQLADAPPGGAQIVTRDAEQIFPAPAATVSTDKRAGPVIPLDEAARRVEEWKEEAKRIGRAEDHSNEVIVSLFDDTGSWSQPYEDAGYTVLRFDLARGDDIMRMNWLLLAEQIAASGKQVVGVLSACPCTSFAGSGARWWGIQHDKPDKEMVRRKYGNFAAEYFDRPVDYAVALVRQTELAVEFLNPSLFYALENPVGRIKAMAGLPKAAMSFNPHHFGDPYTKKTILWGEMNTDLPVANVAPTEGSKVHKLRGDRPDSKRLRSKTPEGFSYAFFMANNTSGRPAAVRESTPRYQAIANFSLARAWRAYDEGTDFTVTELLDEVENIDNLPAEVADAAAALRQRMDEQYDQWGGRDDLDEVEEAFERAVQAAAGGIGVREAYAHGSLNSFERFDFTKAGQGVYGWGAYLSSDTSLAKMYAGGSGGFLYTADIPPGVPMVDWDKPVRDQPELAAAMLAEHSPVMQNKPSLAAWLTPESTFKQSVTGRHVVQWLWQHFRDVLLDEADNFNIAINAHRVALSREAQRRTSEYLRSLGFMGTRYFDEGADATNVVVWDESLLSGLQRMQLREAMQEDRDLRRQLDLFAPENIPAYTTDGALRPDTTDGQKALGIAGLKAVFWRDRQRGARLVGSAIWEGLTHPGGAQLVGLKLSKTDYLATNELAQAAQVLRDNRFETMRIFFVKGDTVVGHTAFSSRLPGQVDFITKKGVNLFEQAVDEGLAAGADGFYMMHNHPSGVPSPSQADLFVTQRAYSDYQSAFRGHIIIDSGHAHVLAPGQHSQLNQRTVDVDQELRQAELPHDLLGAKLKDPTSALAIAKRLQVPDDFAVAVVVNSRNTVTGLVEIPLDILTPPPDAGRKAWVFKMQARFRNMARYLQGSSVGAPFIILYMPKRGGDAARSLEAMSNPYKGRAVADVVSHPDDTSLLVTASSVASLGFERAVEYSGMPRRVAEGGPEYRKGASGPGANYVGMFRSQGAPGDPQTPIIGQRAGDPREVKHAKDPIRREHILEVFQRELGVRIYQGSPFKVRSALGFFRPSNFEVRNKYYNDLEVAAHEVFHWLDRTYPTIRALYHKRRFATQLKGISYDESKLYEGFAEFGRLFMTREADAIQTAPDFYDAFVGELKRLNLWDTMARSQLLMHQWFLQGSDARARSKIGSKPPPLRQRLAAARQVIGDRAVANALDHLQAAKVIESEITGRINPDAASSPYKSLRLMAGSNNVIAAFFNHGTVNWGKGGDTGDLVFTGKGLRQIFEPIGDAMDDAMAYFVGRRANELMRAGKENLFTKDEIVALLDRGRKHKKAAAIEKAFAEYQEFVNRLLDFAVDSGIISRATVNIWRNMYQNYVPFYRVAETLGGAAVSDFSPAMANPRAVFMRLRGSSRNLADPWENITNNVAQVVQAALRNRATRDLIHMIEKSPLGQKYLVRIPTDTHSVSVGMEQIQRVLQDMGSELANQPIPNDPAARAAVLQILQALGTLTDPTNGTAVTDLQDQATFFTFGHPPATPDKTSVMVGGERVWYQVIDPLLWDMLVELNTYKPLSLVEAAFGMVKRVGTRGVTATVEFQIANFFRDSGNAWTMSMGGQRPIIDGLKAMRDIWTESADFRDYLANGGGFGRYVNKEARTARVRLMRAHSRHVILDGARLGLDIFDKWSNAWELATRLAEYKAMRRKGASRREAAFQGREISSDFAMHGRGGTIKFLALSVGFFNARLQGLYRLYRELYEKHGRRQWNDDRARRYLLRAMAGMTLPTIALFLLNENDDDYRALPEDVKNLYWPVKIPGTDRFLLIPRPFETGGLLATMPERMLRHIRDENGQKMWEAVKFVILEAFALDPTPWLVKPPIDVFWKNRRWTGAPIVPDALENVEPTEQFTPYSSRTMIEVGQRFGVSPLKLEAIVRGYFTGLAGYTLAVTDSLVTGGDFGEVPTTQWSRRPIIGRFFTDDPLLRTGPEQDFYQLVREVDRVVSTARKLTNEGRGEDLTAYLAEPERAALLSIAGVTDNIRETAGELRDTQELVRRSGVLSGEEKARQMDQLQRERNKLFMQAMDQLDEGNINALIKRLEGTP